MPGVVLYAKLFLDQMRHSITGPQRSLISELLRSFQQPGHQLRTLLLIQQWLAPRPAGGIQRFLSMLGNSSGPSAHRLTTDLHAPSHFTLVVSLSQQLQGRKAPLLQNSEISFYASRITHASYDDSQWQEVTLYYAIFSKIPARFNGGLT